MSMNLTSSHPKNAQTGNSSLSGIRLMVGLERKRGVWPGLTCRGSMRGYASLIMHQRAADNERTAWT